MKIKNLFALLSIAILISSCGDSPKTTTPTDETSDQPSSDSWQNSYDKIDANDLPDNIFKLIADDWMLITAGNKDSYNTMTASWGGFGNIWNKPSSFIFVRDTRYTYQFLQREESFTLSFFTEDYRGALRICGTKSGRDTDKVKEAGLTPIETPSGLMSFDEARMIIECKKVFVQALDLHNLTEPYKTKIIEEAYTGESSGHKMFISEITNIWLKK